MSNPLSANTQLLLPMSGANNSVIFIDHSSVRRAVHAHGDAKISTTKGKWGTGSGTFDGNGDYLTIAEGFPLYNRIFAIPFWVYRNNSNNNHHIIGYNNISSSFWDIYINTNGKIVFRYNSNDGALTSSASIANNTWTHVLVCYDGTTSRIFIGGTLSGSVASGILSANGVYSFGIGTNLYGGGYEYYLDGYLQDLAIFIDTPLFTSDFTPPSGPFDPADPMTIQRDTQAVRMDMEDGGLYQLTLSVDRQGAPGAYRFDLFERRTRRLIRSRMSNADGSGLVQWLKYRHQGYYAVAHDPNGTLLPGTSDFMTPEAMP